jgi:hypothetical protein
MTKINTNFIELFGVHADTGLITTSLTNGDIRIQPNGTGTIEIDQLQVDSSAITTTATNSNLTLSANGTGNVVVGAITINGTTISSADSTKISIAEAVDINGNLIVTGGQINFTGLPTSDPSVAGRLWNDSGTVKIST